MKYKVRELTQAEFNTYASRIVERCPRGKRMFCDGTPNPMKSGKYGKYGKCKYYVNGQCTYFEKQEGIW